jgi:Recombination endonuclease VII
MRTAEQNRRYERTARLKNPARFLAKTRRAQHKFHGYPTPLWPRPDVCDCCHRHPSPRKGLALDHDHVTGEFRGWLCHHCNLGIGRLGDTVEGVARALAYLKKNKKEAQPDGQLRIEVTG